MMDIRNYWKLPPGEQAPILEAKYQGDLAYRAMELGLVLYEGKYYKPDDVPCDCELLLADHCYEVRGKGDPSTRLCDCPCHCGDPW